MTSEEFDRRMTALERRLDDYDRRRDSDAGADPGELISIYRAFLDLKAEVRRDRRAGGDAA